MVPKHGDDLGPAWTAGAGLAWYAWMVLACANPKDTGRTDNPLCQIDLIVCLHHHHYNLLAAKRPIDFSLRCPPPSRLCIVDYRQGTDPPRSARPVPCASWPSYPYVVHTSPRARLHVAPGTHAWSADADGRYRSHSGACPPCCVRLRRCRCGVVQGRSPNRSRGQAIICRTLCATDILKEVIYHTYASPPLDNPSRCGLPVMDG